MVDVQVTSKREILAECASASRVKGCPGRRAVALSFLKAILSLQTSSQRCSPDNAGGKTNKHRT